jgi:DNA-binding SARP family transcriptional activator
MAELTVHLFGKFSIGSDRPEPITLPGGKTQELFFYLMLHRHQLHSREAIAALLWPECSTVKSRKNLRQALWQLQSALARFTKNAKCELLTIDAESIRMNGDKSMTVDVSIFERAYEEVCGNTGKSLEASQAKVLQRAVELYRGDLLEGCYEDWCLVERERLQNWYLIMLEKLICYSRMVHEYPRAVEYAETILRLDRAHERTYRQLMRTFYESGNRTAALRQYDRCKSALEEELGVEPSQQTQKLCEQIRKEQVGNHATEGVHATGVAPINSVGHLKQLLEFITRIELQVKEELQTAWVKNQTPAPPRFEPGRQPLKRRVAGRALDE